MRDLFKISEGWVPTGETEWKIEELAVTCQLMSDKEGFIHACVALVNVFGSA